ncbi:MAG: cobalamin-dependent protein [Flavobacteriales bacterium]|nr:cobalamin-dependent protein [Flavobacteriales bacterium]
MSTFVQAPPYVPKHKIRVVTAASLFDGHDAAINIMRRIIQSTGAEVIHLGHDRSVEDVVNTAIQEDAHAIAMTSYQGGHTEYFKYMHDLLKEKGAGHIKIFGGGGGTILPEEIKELHAYGITRLYHPDDGRAMGLQGMINDMLEKADFDLSDKVNGEAKKLSPQNWPAIAKLISTAENHPEVFAKIADEIHKKAEANKAPILGITGTGGAGKSSMVDELIRRFILDQPTKTIGVISVDPSKRKTGGALLGDRIRMNSIRGERVYMRSLATRQSNLALSKHVKEAVSILKAAGFDLIVLETSGIGQSDTEILDHSDVSLYIMTPEFGAATQLEKIDMLDFADVVAINKFDKRGAQDAVRDVKKQYKRNHQLWDADDDKLPVVGTIASQFNDPGTNNLYVRLMETIKTKTGVDFHSTFHAHDEMSEKVWIIPPAKSRYLSEISENNRRYDAHVRKQAEIADKLYGLHSAVITFGGPDLLNAPLASGSWPLAAPGETDKQPAASSQELKAPDPQIRRTTQRPRPAPLVHAHRLESRRGEIQRRVLHLLGPRQGDQGAQPHREPQSPEDPEGRAAEVPQLGRQGALGHAGEHARLLPLHRGHLPLQAHRRGPRTHVRRRRRTRAHQQALPLREPGPARRAPQHRLR